AAGLFAENAIALLLPLARRFIFPARMWLRLGRLLAARPFHSARDDDLLGDFFVHRCDEVMSRAIMERTDHRAIAADEHPQDAAFGAAVVLLATELDQHLVAVHG